MKPASNTRQNLSELLALLSSIACMAAHALLQVLGNLEDTSGVAERFEDIKHRGHEINHQLRSVLHRTLIAEFDREDIHQLAAALYEILDRTTAAGETVGTHHIRAAHSYARDLAAILALQCDHVYTALLQLEKHKSDALGCQEVRRLEGEADTLAQVALASLLTDDSDAIETIKLEDLYKLLESATDAAADAADAIETVMLRNVS